MVEANLEQCDHCIRLPRYLRRDMDSQELVFLAHSAAAGLTKYSIDILELRDKVSRYRQAH